MMAATTKQCLPGKLPSFAEFLPCSCQTLAPRPWTKDFHAGGCPWEGLLEGFLAAAECIGIGQADPPKVEVLGR